jgi:hypothetical protein
MSDICRPALQLARRIQNLESGETYVIILMKQSTKHWIITIEPRGKTEVLTEPAESGGR